MNKFKINKKWIITVLKWHHYQTKFKIISKNVFCNVGSMYISAENYDYKCGRQMAFLQYVYEHVFVGQTNTKTFCHNKNNDASNLYAMN